MLHLGDGIVTPPAAAEAIHPHSLSILDGNVHRTACGTLDAGDLSIH
jgi:hypothetical protein